MLHRVRKLFTIAFPILCLMISGLESYGIAQYLTVDNQTSFPITIRDIEVYYYGVYSHDSPTALYQIPAGTKSDTRYGIWWLGWKADYFVAKIDIYGSGAAGPKMETRQFTLPKTSTNTGLDAISITRETNLDRIYAVEGLFISFKIIAKASNLKWSTSLVTNKEYFSDYTVTVTEIKTPLK